MPCCGNSPEGLERLERVLDNPTLVICAPGFPGIRNLVADQNSVAFELQFFVHFSVVDGVGNGRTVLLFHEKLLKQSLLVVVEGAFPVQLLPDAVYSFEQALAGSLGSAAVEVDVPIQNGLILSFLEALFPATGWRS